MRAFVLLGFVPLEFAPRGFLGTNPSAGARNAGYSII